MPDDNETPDDELEAALTKYTESATRSINSQTDAGTRVIEMVRNLLTAFPLENEGSSLSQITQLRRWADVFGELTEKPMTGLSQIQSLTLLAGVIRWFSIESGRSEEEILERLETPFLESRDEGLSLIQQVARGFRA